MSGLESFSSLQLAALALLVFIAGVLDSLAGGGGLITLPAYLAVGLPPGLVLGTNKCASSIGTTASVVRYFRTLELDWRPVAPMIAAALIGSAAGAELALLLDPSWIRPLMLAILPFVAWSVLSKHHVGLGDRSSELSPESLSRRAVGVALPVGAYDGFFGPGAGTFLALGLARFCRYDLLRATGYAKALNLASNLAALVSFMIAKRVNLPLGAAMGAVSLLGNLVGAHLGLKRGAAAIRPAIALICAGLFLKIAFDLSSG
ncbi:MAG: TSUP family transporter [Elusimicrobia bacterium]|nr:TSUP family transporter [Elusimicrobiota bacterium]